MTTTVTGGTTVAGGVTPRAEETLVRLASWMPFAQAQELLEDLVGIQVSKATARRATLATGEAQLSVCEGEVERLSALGARLLYWGQQGPGRWATMVDPDGNRVQPSRAALPGSQPRPARS